MDWEITNYVLINDLKKRLLEGVAHRLHRGHGWEPNSALLLEIKKKSLTPTPSPKEMGVIRLEGA